MNRTSFLRTLALSLVVAPAAARRVMGSPNERPDRKIVDSYGIYISPPHNRVVGPLQERLYRDNPFNTNDHCTHRWTREDGKIDIFHLQIPNLHGDFYWAMIDGRSFRTEDYATEWVLCRKTYQYDMDRHYGRSNPNKESPDGHRWRVQWREVAYS